MKTIKSIHVYDFDGTVVDSSHRYSTMVCDDGVTRIDLPHWRANEHRVLDDTLLPLAAEYKRDLADPSVYVVVATARVWCHLTEEFCRREGMTPQHVIARRDQHDSRGGAELKILGLKKLTALRQFQDCAMRVYEDNTSYLKNICDFFQAEGRYYPSVQGH